MHASLHKSRRENHRRVVFIQQDTIYSRARLVFTNLLITSLLVLCFSPMISFVSASKISFDFMSPDSCSDICYLGTDELIIFVSFLWMIWVDLAFLIYLSIYLKHNAWLWRDLKLLLSSMNALDKAKPQGKESVGTRPNQSHSQKCQINSNVAN